MNGPVFRLTAACALFPGLLVVCLAARAQQPDTLAGTLPEIEVAAARGTETVHEAPLAVTVLARPPALVRWTPGLSLDDVLASLPGLWVNDRGHFALGERLAVRGMGSRAPFGVRGVQVLLDGVPLTMPDGQAVLDIVDPAFVRRAELIRGPASHFWGNGGGGALFLTTAAFTDHPTGRVRALAGSYGTRHLAAEAALPAGRHRLHGFASDFRRDGYRAHSAGRFTRAGLHGDFDLGPRTRLRLTTALADQDAEHPGSLTRAEMNANPRAANPGFAGTGAGKTSFQAQSAVTLLHETPNGLLATTAFGLVRDLDNPLPFAYIALDRRAGGLRLTWRNEGARIPYGLALDAAIQHDDRRNFDNDGGRPGPGPLLDQIETVRNLAAAGYARLPLSARLHLTLGLRADHLRFAMTDRLLSNGDQSGNRTFFALSPSAGLAYTLNPIQLFVNARTAFETPTTTELVNRPDLTGGFNPDLEPERTRGLEAGLRGTLPRLRLDVDLAVFHLDVMNRLVPFQTAEGGDRTFFRNSGGLTHTGVEVALSWALHPSITLATTYTAGRFVFSEGEHDGNRLPGVPDHRLFAGLQTTHHGLWGRLTLEAVSAHYTDDANTTRNAGYTLLDVYAGHTGLDLGTARLEPFLKAGNVLDVQYSGSVSINAFGGRYFEPAPGRTLEAGLNLVFD
ncbi:TonB-dependent receptor [Rhodocaloribacter litoris]|uniref:TonB-dependent receptor family protein n=1 Tax=Rhodocaloribacter litoris TaxID=2558931 RepID=UPI0014234DEF|nr:TonB-dependent receptor [Rhodocaloribacter litoris]QXD15890.1 TonB-dependent receptor [Rhodocaloribacter litoris]